MPRTVLLLLVAGVAFAGVSAHSHNDFRARHQPYVVRQAPPAAAPAASSAPAPAPAPAPASAPASAPPAPAPSPASPSQSAAGSQPQPPPPSQAPPASTPAALPGPPPPSNVPVVPSGISLPAPGVSGIPPLTAITAGMPVETIPLAKTPQLGAPGPFPGFPPLPSTTFDRAAYPTPVGTIVPIINPSEVAQWLTELEGHNIPDIPPTKPGGCPANPEAVADTTRCWWTCGGCRRPTDITTCPDKLTWGLTFDDGPSPQTPKLLNYLEQQNLNASFCIVGGSGYYNPTILQAEYLAGHHIILHTYRHPMLTTLSTVDVVAEFGYTRKLIKDLIGVTPAYFRPPYGDVDDRIRAIAAAMGMQTSIWTRNDQTGEQFDTNDWQIESGQVSAVQSFESFQYILGNASLLPTGFICLEHDLYPSTVDMGVGYFLPTALNHTPKFNIQPVIDCLHLPPSEAYVETKQNKTVAIPDTTWTGALVNVSSLQVVATNGSGSPGSAGAPPPPPNAPAATVGGDTSGGQSGGDDNAAVREGVKWLAVLGAVVMGLVVA